MHRTLRRRTLAALAAVVAATVAVPSATAQSDVTACTAMACSSGVTVNLRDVRSTVPSAARAELCVEDVCSTTRSLRTISTEVRGEPDSPVRIRLRVYDKRGKVVRTWSRTVQLKPTYPNGEACPGVCFNRLLAITKTGKLLVRDA